MATPPPPRSSSMPSLPPPCPKSPPAYPDLYGKRRETAKVQMLEREIGFLQEELKSAERIQPASRCCKEVADFIVANPDPLMPTNRRKRRSCRCWKWLCGFPCFNLSWICCCCYSKCCSINLEMPQCCKCKCSPCDCCCCKCPSCFSCSLPKWRCPRCSCSCPRPNCCKKKSCNRSCCCLFPSSCCSCPDCPSCRCKCKCKCSCPPCL
ncbi:guanine nucleotide-binding protein subunit gamma 3 [Cannabis sativa]|uniref:guanine nucleotide-binding protein subunit gamma 3 n=1 Tax=Cannabis sativa TaxID=3483 RepID=UPI0029CA79FE|nr:guanine nucleotide-binding protein subunit gamma 3 [Cannabis sativa]XP_030489553.2 guanine nucleotide-binding protein subunit gamma 3 [Cannabis sativa]XP_060961350.1 guanine nucleotide-binding protein subunit gamma 3 [Cannabis sativa]